MTSIKIMTLTRELNQIEDLTELVGFKLSPVRSIFPLFSIPILAILISSLFLLVVFSDAAVCTLVTGDFPDLSHK